MTLNAACDRIRDDLDAAGLTNVTDDPRNLQPPGVLVGMPGGLLPAPCGVMGTVSVWVLAPPPANLDARRDLLDRVEVVAAALGSGWTRCDEGSFFPDTGGPAMPGYRFTVPLTS
jgi:hypothetical protein